MEERSKRATGQKKKDEENSFLYPSQLLVSRRTRNNKRGNGNPNNLNKSDLADKLNNKKGRTVLKARYEGELFKEAYLGLGPLHG